MKKILYMLTLSIFIFSCEDVVEVTVPNAPPRLVIEASLNWFDGTSGENQTIKLTQSAPFFNNQVSPATGATVTVSNESNIVFSFVDNNLDGNYECTNFAPNLNETYTLNIIYNNETYVGSETMTSVTPIDFIEQKNDGGFSGEAIEIKAYYTDPAEEENYYFFEFKEEHETNPFLNVYDDEFINGNQIFAFYSNEDTAPGHELIIKNYGVSEQFYDFMFLLLQQSDSAGGGPFEVQPATVRGNCINVTNPDHFPFGYFRASQATEFIYIIE
ncbi:DUF4249 domain-containing protein [Lacinutrix neustonica]|uniref:DUF4249 domain-containing protein n=1 Tax=Lacinutrix neustonica TaxID=2980107 RepID=A0A9E8MXD3_9FLAO|nr:DUF4249 domain-containing protein [Lacinutrix neustonica]WAC02024.1 DUF4249 domain-containing protein [Lacinutrix neustonica]